MYENGEYSVYPDESTALEYALDDCWIEEDNKHYCPDCYTEDENGAFIIKFAHPVWENRVTNLIKDLLYRDLYITHVVNKGNIVYTMTLSRNVTLPTYLSEAISRITGKNVNISEGEKGKIVITCYF